MKRITVLLLMCLLLTPPLMGYAQSKTVSGTIIDGSDNQPLVGATIIAVGSTAGATSGKNGRFQFIAPAASQEVLISYIGYTSQTVAIGVGELHVTLQYDAEAIEAVQIVNIGYGTVKKSDLTGSVASISASELMASSPFNAQQGLQGRIAGVNVLSTDGAPGAGMSIQIRGTNSFNGSTEPLYVIDGVPVTSDNRQESVSLDTDNVAQRNALSFLNPSDIESMEILKDASSTAIYGSRGSNGVVLITTKSGKSGQAKVNLTYNLSVSSVSKKLHMLDSRSYAEMRNQSYINTQFINGASTVTPGNVPYPGLLDEETGKYSKGPADYDTGNNTYWQDQVFRTAISHDMNLNISGATKDMDYAISGGYLRQEGVVINSDYTRYNFKINVNKTINRWLKIGTSTNFSYSKSSMLKNATKSWNNGNEGVIRSALYFPATYQMGDTQSEEDRYRMVTNPVLYANALNQNKNYNIYTSNYALFTIAKGLMFKTSFGYNTSINFANQYFDRNLWEGREPVNGLSAAGDNTWSSIVFDNLLMYNRDFGKHNVSATVGTSWESSNWYNKSVMVQGFGSDLTDGWLLGDAGTMTSAYSSKGEAKLFSIIMRAAYNYDNRYYLTFTARQDYSGKFVQGKRGAFFPSIGVSWRATQEKFMQKGKIKNIITNLKLRYSYGLSGNQAIASYATFANQAAANYPFGGTVINGYAIDIYNPGNKDLKWETTYQHDVGIDLQLFGRVDLTLDVYHKMTNDLLQPKQKALSTGLDKILSNFGSVMNRGIEMAVNAEVIRRKDWRWTVGGNLSINQNKIVELGTDSQYPNTLWNSYRPFVLADGRPIGQLIGFNEDGIWASREDVINSSQFQHQYPGYTVDSKDSATETIIRQKWIGEIRYEDRNGDDVVNDDDMDYLGNTNPKFNYGFSTSLSYKGFDLNVLFQGVSGNKILNQPLFRWYNSGESRNVPVSIMNEVWSPENLEGTAPKLYTTYGRDLKMSSRFLEDGSYLKLRTLSLSYTFSKPFKGVGNIRITFSGNNLWTITDYSGYDPEVNSFGTDPNTRGIDSGAYPQSRSYVFGVNLTF